MMAYAPEPLSGPEVDRLAGLTSGVISAGAYAEWLKAIEAGWSADKLGTARDKAFAARPRGDRCVYCQDNEGRELDHLRPKSLHPELGWCWSNLVPACGTCGGPAYKGARDAVLDPTHPQGWRDISRPHTPAGAARRAPPAGQTAWWNPRRADPMRAMKLDIVDDSFLFLITAAPGSADHARISWTVEKLRLNRRATLVRQRRAAHQAYARWLVDVIDAQMAADRARLDRLRVDLADHNQPVVWAEMKRQRADLPAIDAQLRAAPQVVGW